MKIEKTRTIEEEVDPEHVAAKLMKWKGSRSVPHDAWVSMERASLVISGLMKTLRELDTKALETEILGTPFKDPEAPADSPVSWGPGHYFQDVDGNLWCCVDKSNSHGLSYLCALTRDKRGIRHHHPRLCWFNPDGTIVSGETIPGGVRPGSEGLTSDAQHPWI